MGESLSCCDRLLFDLGFVLWSLVRRKLLAHIFSSSI